MHKGYNRVELNIMYANKIDHVKSTLIVFFLKKPGSASTQRESRERKLGRDSTTNHDLLAAYVSSPDRLRALHPPEHGQCFTAF